MTGGSPVRMAIIIALRELLPKPSLAYGSTFKNNHRHEGAPLADMPSVAFNVAFGGKADIVSLTAHVRYCTKADMAFVMQKCHTLENLFPNIGGLFCDSASVASSCKTSQRSTSMLPTAVVYRA